MHLGGARLEGRLYRVLWEERDGRFSVRLKRAPEICAEGASLQEALDAVMSPICDRYGDGKPQFELEPPEAVDRRVAHLERFVTLMPGDGPDFVESDGPAFEGKLCKRCHIVAGKRSASTLRLKRGWTASQAGMGQCDEMRLWLVTQRFLDVLREMAGESLGEEFEVRPVEGPAKSRRKYFELVARRVVARVRWSRLRYETKRCLKCKRVMPWSFDSKELGVKFLAAEQMPRPAPALFAVGTEWVWKLAVGEEMWRGKGWWNHPACRGIYSDTYAFVLPRGEAVWPDAEVEARA